MKHSLVGYWPLYETSGSTANDLSGNGNDGSVTGAGPAATGTVTPSGTPSPPQDSAYDFDGGDDFINGPDFGFTNSDSWTVAGWLRFDVSGNNYLGGYIDQSDNSERIIVYRSGSNDIQAQVGNVTDSIQAIGSTTTTTGTWYHVAATFNSTDDELIVYLSGKRDGSASGTVGTITTDNSTFYFGARNDGGTAENFLDGQLADVRVYDRALTPNEVAYLYEAGNRARLVTSTQTW